MVTKLDKVDVVTVGVGWSGGIIAAELSKAGYKVIGLERGGNRETEDFANKHDELKYVYRHELMHDLSNDTITFRNNLDQSAAPLRDAGSLVTGTGVGGGGLHWNAETHRYFPYDFEIRSKTIERYGEEKIPDGMTIQDWGITYDEIEPYYDKFEKIMGISGEEDPSAALRSNPYPNPPMKKTKAIRLFEESAKNLGYHPFMLPSGNVTERYENPDGQILNACQYNGFCAIYGCEWGARATPITTVIPTAQQTGNFELRTNAEVKRVLHNGDQATGVLYVDTRTGEEFEQPAEIVVLTSYIFNNVRLLLLSEIGKPYNPENGEGVIGKNFTDHHNYFAGRGFFNDQKFNTYIGAGALGISFTDFSADNFDHTNFNFIHGGQVQFHQEGAAPILSDFVPQDTPTWGKEYKENSLFYYHRTVSLVTQKAVMPWKDHYIDLDPEYTDDSGDPLLRVTWDYTEQDRELHEMMKDVCGKLLTEMGADIVEVDDMPEHFTPGITGQHCAGGVIMGNDPETSAVNNYMQMWDMDNLFVCGASAYPHFGSSNPTLTLGALTYRAAEGIVQYLDNDGGLLIEPDED